MRILIRRTEGRVTLMEICIEHYIMIALSAWRKENPELERPDILDDIINDWKDKNYDQYVLNVIDDWESEHVGEYISHYEIALKDIPQDRYFREAWGHNLEVDMIRAPVIHMDNIRQTRDLELFKSDIDFRKALESWILTGDDTEARAVITQTQTLRDLPTSFDLSGAGTPEELKALWPEELKKDT